MSDRWKIEIKDLNHEPTILHAEPNMEVMTEFVNEAVNKLQKMCAKAEEQFIFGSSPTDVLIRIRDFCDAEISRRGSKP